MNAPDREQLAAERAAIVDATFRLGRGEIDVSTFFKIVNECDAPDRYTYACGALAQELSWLSVRASRP